MALFLHSGSNAATLEQVAAVETPMPTESWHPVPHLTLINEVRSQITAFGLQVVAEDHGLYKAGARYFGVLQVRNGHDATDFGLALGLRNSHDKRFPAGLAVGSQVFVCDNLAFSSEIVIGRRHTSRILLDLPGLVNRTLGRLGDHRVALGRRIDAYKGAALTDAVAHDVVVRSLDARVIPTTSLPAVVHEWRQPRHADFAPRTVWSLFNSFTEIMKGTNVVDLARRTQALHGLMDNVVGLDVVLAVKGGDGASA
jgi:hypothetical protein